ncbi:MAG: type I-E CRISPR-associated protein Cse1/CasA [Elusimicrobia bacterium]|nr:type I-E CRISPR-associated protein Cse1/CasA [Elusimicrobiota bacterium]
MSKFNLIDEKWIPVRFLDGTRDELGISNTLSRAKEIAAIEDNSPLVVASLHRFLLAVLYRALQGPADIEQAKYLFKSGLPDKPIKDYLEKWRPRFWLFDEKYPFYQIPSFKPKKWREWTALAVEYNADTAKVLFDHTHESASGSISMAAASRWLLASQVFAVSTGKSEISHTGTSPSANSIMAIPIGSNLQDTLIFCLVPQNRIIMTTDIPVWERKPDTMDYLKTKVRVTNKEKGASSKYRTVERTATGIVDLYTWRTRSVILKELNSGNIEKLGFASGIGYKESIMPDPMLAYTIREVTDKESSTKLKKRFSLKFEEEGAWKDFDSLLPDSAQLAPQVIDNAITLAKQDVERFPRGVMVLGQRYFPPRPNIAFWRKEYFVLPRAILSRNDMRFEIHAILVEAKNVADKLSDVCKIFAKGMLGHGGRKIEALDVENFAAQLPALPGYWSVLEARFHEILGEYSANRDADDIRCQWLGYVRDALKNAWEQFSASVDGGDAWAIRALVKAEVPVLTKINELNEEIAKYAKQEVNQ